MSSSLSLAELVHYIGGQVKFGNLMVSALKSDKYQTTPQNKITGDNVKILADLYNFLAWPTMIPI